MSPYSRTTGQRYAAGSNATWGGWETRVCAVCGKRVTLDQAAYHSARGLAGQPFSVHVACGTFQSVLRPVSEAA